LKFYEDYTKCIEIKFCNGRQYRVYFKVDPYYKFLTNNSKIILQAEDSFAEQNDKINSFLNVIDKVHYETLHLKKLDTHALRFTKGRLDFLRACTLYIMYSYCLVLFCTWKRNVFENHSYIVNMTFFGIDYSEEYIRLAGFCQLIVSVFMLAFWIVIYTPLIVREKWREIEQEAKNEFKR